MNERKKAIDVMKLVCDRLMYLSDTSELKSIKLEGLIN